MIWPAHLISLLALVASLPFSKAKSLDVWTPQIEIPNSTTIWSLRNPPYLVRWNTSQPPPEVSNYTGAVYLVHNNLIDYGKLPDHPLAQGFNLLSGEVEVQQLPCDTKPGTYQVDLLGDSGNWSANFTIVE
ncbi:hypothetical protein OG21DRAFT_1419219 [Imleria badia]|nr:hypothetical protein OG21DRAFT_1419219 [Imleria badia]